MASHNICCSFFTPSFKCHSNETSVEFTLYDRFIESTLQLDKTSELTNLVQVIKYYDSQQKQARL